MSSILKDIRAAFGNVEAAPYTVVVQRGGYEERLYPRRWWACTTMSGPSRSELITPMFRRLFSYISGRNEPNVRMDMTTPVVTYVEPHIDINGKKSSNRRRSSCKKGVGGGVGGGGDGGEGGGGGGREGIEGGLREGDITDHTFTISTDSSYSSSSSFSLSSSSSFSSLSYSSSSSLPSSSSLTYTMSVLIPGSHQHSPPSTADKRVFFEKRKIAVYCRRFSGYISDEVERRELAALKDAIVHNEEHKDNIDFASYYVVGYDPPFKILGRRNEIWFVKKAYDAEEEGEEEEEVGELNMVKGSCGGDFVMVERDGEDLLAAVAKEEDVEVIEEKEDFGRQGKKDVAAILREDLIVKGKHSIVGDGDIIVQANEDIAVIKETSR